MSPELISFRQADLLPTFQKSREFPHGQYIIHYILGLEAPNGIQIYFMGEGGRCGVCLIEDGREKINSKLSSMFESLLKEKGFTFGFGGSYKNIMGTTFQEVMQYIEDLVGMLLAYDFPQAKIKVTFDAATKKGEVLFNL